MSTYSALYYHLVWSTKKREPLIDEIIEDKLHRYMAGIIYGKNGKAIQIGGMPDHIHILLRTGPDNNISQLVKDIKISCTKWMKQRMPKANEFYWQEGFSAFSVSKSNTDAVQKYILDQKEHHKAFTFEKEIFMFLDKHGVEYDMKYVLT